jgi:hypothetical protein
MILAPLQKSSYKGYGTTDKTGVMDCELLDGIIFRLSFLILNNVLWLYRRIFIVLRQCFFFLVILGFEFRASGLLDRHLTT